MLHFVTSYMKQNKSRKETVESAQYGLEIIFNGHISQGQNYPKPLLNLKTGTGKVPTLSLVCN